MSSTKKAKAKAAAIRSSLAKKRRPGRDNREPETRADLAKGSPGCWCGKPWPHDWAGKDRGRPHPR